MNGNQLPSYFLLAVIGIGLHVSIAIYVGVVFFLSQGAGWTTQWVIHEDKRLIFNILAGLSTVMALLAFYLPRLLPPASRLPGQPTRVGETDRPLIFDFKIVDQRIMTVTIVRMALAESVAIYGLINAFLNQSLSVVFPFAAGGLLVQFVVGPFFRKFFPS